MNLLKLISQLHEQTGSASRLYEQDGGNWIEKYSNPNDSDRTIKDRNNLVRKIEKAIAEANDAIEVGYFLKAIAQKDIMTHIADAMYDLGRQMVLLGMPKRDGTYMSDDAKKLGMASVPRGLGEKGTKAFVDLARKAHGSKIDYELDLLMKMTKLRLQVAALPVDKNKKPPSKSALAASEREGVAMTCQVCGGKYLASKGKIAHHGYQRPGGGWQTQSCFGAMAVPFEVSRDRLGEWIEILRSQVKSAKMNLKFVSESPELTLTGKADSNSPLALSKGVKVTAETFVEMRAELSRMLKELKAKDHYSPVVNAKVFIDARTFDELRKLLVWEAERDLKGLKEYLDSSEKRYDNWKPQEKVA